jgi:hypothetical protein
MTPQITLIRKMRRRSTASTVVWEGGPARLIDGPVARVLTCNLRIRRRHQAERLERSAFRHSVLKSKLSVCDPGLYEILELKLWEGWLGLQKISLKIRRIFK